MKLDFFLRGGGTKSKNVGKYVEKKNQSEMSYHAEIRGKKKFEITFIH